MSEHVFHFSDTANHTVVIESDLSRDEAENLAWDKLPASLCHNCAREYEMAGDWELQDGEEESE